MRRRPSKDITQSTKQAGAQQQGERNDVLGHDGEFDRSDTESEFQIVQ